MANPFAAFSIQVGSAGIPLAANNHGRATAVEPSVLQGHAVRALPLQKATPNSGKHMSSDEDWWHIAEKYRTVVRVLGSGSNDVTEELVVGMLNHAKSLGISTEDPRFLKERLSTEGPEIFVRCKVAARAPPTGTALSSEGARWAALGVRLPRCEDYSRTRKDRAYAFSSSLSAVAGMDCFEPGDADCGLLTFDAPEPLSLQPGMF